jgi:hypothetical protein
VCSKNLIPFNCIKKQKLRSGKATDSIVAENAKLLVSDPMQWVLIVSGSECLRFAPGIQFVGNLNPPLEAVSPVLVEQPEEVVKDCRVHWLNLLIYPNFIKEDNKNKFLLGNSNCVFVIYLSILIAILQFSLDYTRGNKNQ